MGLEGAGWLYQSTAKTDRQCLLVCFSSIWSATQSSFPEVERIQSIKVGLTLHIYCIVNAFRTDNILAKLCEGYSKHELSGNLCDLVCSSPRNWSIIDFHQGGTKRVLRINSNGTEYVLKSTKDFFGEFIDKLDPLIEEDELTDKIVEIINEQTNLGYPVYYKRHLIKTLWPNYNISKRGEPQLSQADRTSLWALLQQVINQCGFNISFRTNS